MNKKKRKTRRRNRRKTRKNRSAFKQRGGGFFDKFTGFFKLSWPKLSFFRWGKKNEEVKKTTVPPGGLPVVQPAAPANGTPTSNTQTKPSLTLGKPPGAAFAGAGKKKSRRKKRRKRKTKRKKY